MSHATLRMILCAGAVVFLALGDVLLAGVFAVAAWRWPRPVPAPRPRRVTCRAQRSLSAVPLSQREWFNEQFGHTPELDALERRLRIDTSAARTTASPQRPSR